MPIINFTPADDMIAIIINESGYYEAEIKEVDGPKTSGSGKSQNTFLRFNITDPRYAGKAISVAFSTGSDSVKLLGNLMWMPMGMLKQVFAATQNILVKEVPAQSNTDDLQGKKLAVKVDLQTTPEHGIFNTISGFLSAGKGTAANKPAF